MADFTHTWTTFIQPSLTPAAALIGALSASFVAWRFGSIQAGIARQQAATAAAAAATARNKLKLELFERRVAIYDVLHAYIEAANDQQLNGLERFAFHERVHPARWLLDEKILDWVHRDLAHVVDRYQTAREEIYSNPDADIEVQTEFTSSKRHLMEQFGVLRRLFDPYLKLEH